MVSAARIDWTKVDDPSPVFQAFPSRRSVVYGTKGVVSSSQPLATAAGLEILNKGGNAGTIKPFVLESDAPDHCAPPADAAVATSAALNVTEPCSCGIGG
jgi:gamma-glutamyltranspeptidase/glutathione hydrolase